MFEGRFDQGKGNGDLFVLPGLLSIANLTAMEYRRLGHTGLDLSVVGFGASPLGGVFGDVTRETAVDTVSTALDVRLQAILLSLRSLLACLGMDQVHIELIYHILTVIFS